MKNKLEIDSILLKYNEHTVLKDIYLSCEKGSIIGLLGRNGCGKSSLLKIISGNLIPLSKSIRLDNKFLNDEYRSPNDMMYAPQFNYIPNHLRINRILSDFNLDIKDLIKDFPEFAELGNIRFNKLSGGLKRILEIYIVLVSKTKFCLLDEPFSQIMPIHVEHLKNIITREKENKGIIITDHLYEHVKDISDEIYIINNGKTYQCKTENDLTEYGYLKEKTCGNIN